MRKKSLALWITLTGFVLPAIGHADVVTEWNLRTAQYTFAARFTGPEATRTVATAGVAVCALHLIGIAWNCAQGRSRRSAITDPDDE